MGYYHYVLRKALLSAGIAALVPGAVQATGGQGVAVTLMWNANREHNIAGYRLYYGTEPQTYTERVDVGNTTTAIVYNLTGGSVYFFALTAYNTAGFESFFSSAVTYAAPAPTPPPVPTPTATPTASPLITVLPTTVNFTAVAGGSAPAPQSIQVTTSNSAPWSSFDSSPWFDAHPRSGPSGASTVLTPHTEGLVPGIYFQNITFSAPGLPNKVVVVNLTVTPAEIPIWIFRDDFDRADGDPGPNWTSDATWGGGLSIYDNKVIARDSGAIYWTANTFADDQYSQIRLTGAVGPWSGVIVRGNLRPGPYYLVRVKPDGADLYSSLNGSFARLTHDDTVWVTGDVLRLEVRTVAANTAHLTVYRNGAELFSYDDTDSFIASGQPGIGLHDSIGEMSLDDWEGGYSSERGP